MVGLTLLASATNYASNLIFGRMLSPESFGDLTALMALAVVVTTPTTAAQTVIAERVAASRAAGDEKTLRYLVRHASAHVLLVSVGVGVLYLVAVPVVTAALDLQARGPAIALTALIMLMFFWPYALGILQGLERFVAYGVMLLAAAVMRIAFGVPWAAAGGGAGGAIAGQALGVLIAIVFVAWLLRRLRLPRGTGAATSGLRRRPDSRAVAASGAFVAFAALSNVDVVLAKLFLEPAGSGEYAALVTIEKVVLFMPGAIAVVMVPAAARARVGARSAAGVLRVAAFAVVATAAIVAVPAALFPGTLLQTMFGDRYVAATNGVMPIVVAGVGLAVLNLLVTYTVAINDRRWVWLALSGIALQALGIAFFHSSAPEVAVVQACVVLAVIALNEVLFHPLVRKGRVLLRQVP